MAENLDYLDLSVDNVKGQNQLIHSRLARCSCAVAAILMAAMLFMGAEQAADVPMFPAPFDKVVHFAYYGAMAGLLSHAVGLRWLWVPLIVVPLVGGADEWNQSFIVDRDASVWDLVADVIGTAVFVYGYQQWRTGKYSRSERA